MAVVVRNGYKNLGANIVIDNLNMTIDPGLIYGLMGASGCGKTTLLSCMVGLKELDSGEISVFGSRPGQRGSGVPGRLVGYMPQEIALYYQFTIFETFAYYGKIYGMTSKEIKKRTQFLVDFLQLPNTSKRMETLSGGEERRVSLAVALIHSPRLLVLDEPTVGLDPLLRQSIWDHMGDLVRSEDKTTILITTHYYDEAKFCDVVGIMRRGYLLAEENPLKLMSMYNSISLESVVLQLCKEDEEKNGSQWKMRNLSLSNNKSSIKFGHKSVHAGLEYYDDIAGVELKNVRQVAERNNDSKCVKISNNSESHEPSELSKSRKNDCKDFDIICSLAKKNFILQRRHPLTVVGQIFLPLLQTMLYHLVVGREPLGMSVAYVSTDWNRHQEALEMANISQTHQRLIEFCNDYNLYTNGTMSCFRDGMTGICNFLNHFEMDEINWVPTTSLSDSINLVQRGDAIAYIEFPANFTYFLWNRIAYGNYADNETVQGSSVNFRMDVSDALSSGWLRDRVLNRYLGFLNETVTGCSNNTAMASVPLKYNPIYGDMEDQDWIQYIQPSLIIILIFLSSNMPGMMWAMEKRLGIADRGAAAGIKFGHIVAASFASDTVVILGQIALFFIVLPTFYGMIMEGSWTLAMALVFINSLAGITMGFMWASICNHEIDVIMLQIFFSSIITTSTGGIWPLEAVASWYKAFCLCLPVSSPIAAMRAIVFKGWGFCHPVVFQGFAVAVIWLVGTLALSIWMNRRKK